MDYLTYLYLLIFGILAFMLKPLIIMCLLKLKFGKKVLIQWYPFEGFVTSLVRNFKKYGDILYEDKLNLYPQSELKLMNSIRGDVIYQFFRSAHIKFILNNQRLYRKISNVTFGERFLYKGIAFQEGEDWKISRRILSRSFEFQQLKSRIPLVMAQCKNIFTYNENQPINIIDDASRIAGEIVTQTFFTSNFNENNNEKSFTQQVYECMLNILANNQTKWSLILRSLIFKNTRNMPNIFITAREKILLNQLEEVKGKIRAIIEKRLQGPEHPDDFLQAYVEEMRINPNITIDHAVQQYLILLFTGIDTTSNQFGLCCYALSINAEVQNKLRTSIKETINEYDELSSENINKMVYLNAFIDECLRMYSPVPNLIEREAVEDHYIGEYYIRKNTRIFASLLPNNFNGEIYKNPNEFNPDRWINDKTIEPFQFTPFSAGSRNCIGQHLSIIELKCMLIFILLNYTIEKGVDQIHRAFKFVYTIQEENFIKIKKLK